MLENLLLRLEAGYSKHENPYHNLAHAADVAQTTHHILSQSGLAVSHLEITFELRLSGGSDNTYFPNVYSLLFPIVD